MSNEISWYTDKRVVYLRLWGDLTAEDIADGAQTIVARYFSGGIAPVHVLIDVADLKEFPTNLRVLKGSAVAFLSDKALGWIVIVGQSNPLVGYLASVLTQVFEVRLRMVDTVQEAEIFLETLDSTLAGALRQK